MKNYEKLLAAKVLGWAAEAFSNHGCNDVNQALYAECGLSDEDKAELLREMREWNGVCESWPEKLSQIGDYALMQFFADKLKREADSGQMGSVPGGIRKGES